MIEIETFLKTADGEFVKVESCHTPPPDLDYIEGAIRISVDGIDIIGLRECDYVDQLWCYVAEMAAKLNLPGRVETYFPDQPIKLSFEVKGARVLVSAHIGKETRRANVSLIELRDQVKAAGIAFFGKMSEIAPANSYAEAQRDLSV
ncbi:hypothetical protein [Kitasatospora sp. NPDC059803]|uniref:hypothetical protein n=1 Tax=Kitasatospora sp. NPDC059803 TaxID=3346953 RepID=UPI003651B6DB